jgi:hypothetical protein
MEFQEIHTHDYIMNGIYSLYPKEYNLHCKSIDEDLKKFLDLGHMKNEDLPKFNSCIFSLDEIFGKKSYFIIIPGLLHVTD